MARQDREVRCLPHEFLLMQPVVCAQMPQTRALLQHAYLLSFTAPTNLHCPVCVAWWCLGEGTMYGPKKMI